MYSYTVDEARHIVMKLAKQYEKNLLNKMYIIIYRDRTDNVIKYLEVKFGKENFQHLTGVELIDKQGKIRKNISELFFEKCLRNRLAKNEICFRKDGTTNLKLTALPIIMNIQKVTKIAGNYNGVRPYLVVDKLIGNVNFCLGLKEIQEDGCYVPVSTLLDDIKSLTDVQSQVLAIFSKEMSEEIYKNIRHVAKGVNLHQIQIPQHICEKITLENYIPKEK